jgi:peptidoglycan hydrolase-like protein with peptidoglycan-binding domain
MQVTPPYIHAPGSSAAAWILGSTLLLLLVAVIFVLPEPSLFQQGLVHFFIDLTGALLSYFFFGGFTFRGRVAGFTVAGGGAFVVFVFLAMIDPFASKTAIADFAPHVLRRDATVAIAQEALKVRGLYRGEVNGRPNSATRHAILQFQAENHLPTGGYVDAATIRELTADARELTQSSRSVIGAAASPEPFRGAAAQFPASGVRVNLPPPAVTSASVISNPLRRGAGAASQLEYREATLSVSYGRDEFGNEETRATVSISIRNTGSGIVRVALMPGLSVQLDTGLTFTRLAPETGGVSGVTYCESRSADQCMQEANPMVVLRPKELVTAQIRLAELGPLSQIEGAQRARFSGQLYAQDVDSNAPSIRPIEVDGIELVIVSRAYTVAAASLAPDVP